MMSAGPMRRPAVRRRVAASDSATSPTVTRTWSPSGRTMNGPPGATPIPHAARRNRARRSSATRIHRLIPSPSGCATPPSASTRDTNVRRLAYDARAWASESPVAGSRSSSSSTDCRMRLLQPGPRRRRLAIAETMSPAPPTAASRRSGPWLLEKLRMWTVWSGSHRPRLTSGAPEISFEWSSSTTITSVPTSTSASAAARVADTATPVGLWARGCRKSRTWSQAQRIAQTFDGQAVGVDVDRDHLAPELLEQVEHRRERGVLDDDSVAEAEHVLGDAIEGVHRPVDDGHRLRLERPQLGEHGFELGQHRMVEVARRQRLPTHAGDDRSEVGQQGRVGRARRQVELEVTGTLRDASIAARLAGPLGRRTSVPLRPLVSIAPTSARLRQASLTVVGETPSRRATSRTVGRRVPSVRLPAEIMRPITAAMPRALRSSPPVAISATISGGCPRRGSTAAPP